MKLTSQSPHAGPSEDAAFESLMRRVDQRIRQGLAPPPEIYQTPHRQKVDWMKLPAWARPSDPDLFDGGHEG